MNITTATVTAATVTIYFVGLVHFQHVGSGAVDVIVPLATSTNAVHKGTSLAPHRADIEVTGFTSCPATGTVVPATSSTPETCRIAGVSGVTISPPTTTATPALTTTDGFGSVPHLELLCADTAGGLRDEYEDGGDGYAVRMRLDKGKLTGRVNVHAWGAALEIENASNSFAVGTETVELSNTADAKVWIKNQPVETGSTDDKAHFLWYYKMYRNAGTCEALPAARTTAHSPEEPAGPHEYGTGVGCSNTQYP